MSFPSARVSSRGEPGFFARGVDVREDGGVLGSGGAGLLDGGEARGFAVRLHYVHHELKRLTRVIADVSIARGDSEVVGGSVGEVGRASSQNGDAHGGSLGVTQSAVEVEEHGGGVGVDGRGGHRDVTCGADEGGTGGGLRGKGCPRGKE